ncbi:hypothetical protein Tco_0086379 [Tanacetum coccineum]
MQPTCQNAMALPTLKVVLLGIASLLARNCYGSVSHTGRDGLANFGLKGYEDKVAILTGLKLQVSTLKKQVSRLNDKLSSSDASFAKYKAKGKERKKKIKSLTKSLDNLHAENFLASDEFSVVQGEILSLAASHGFKHGLSMHQTKDEFAAVLKKMDNFMPGAHDRLAEASPFVARIDYAFLNKISEHASEPLSVILQLELEKLARSANVPTLEDARVSSHITKELTMTPASKYLELSTNADLTPSVVASEHNEEMGISVALKDAVELVVIGLGCASSGPNDVMVTLSAGEKGDGLVPSDVASEDAVVNPSGV